VSQPIAKQLNLTSGNAPANATYVPLPQFFDDDRHDWRSEDGPLKNRRWRDGGEIHRQRHYQHGHQRRIARWGTCLKLLRK